MLYALIVVSFVAVFLFVKLIQARREVMHAHDVNVLLKVALEYADAHIRAERQS